LAVPFSETGACPGLVRVSWHEQQPEKQLRSPIFDAGGSEKPQSGLLLFSLRNTQIYDFGVIDWHRPQVYPNADMVNS
jgi:hypothetical protein